MKLLILLTTLLSFNADALLYLNGYGGISGGNIKEMNEVTGGQDLSHDGWNFGIHTGARVGVSIGLIKAGLVGEFGKIQMEMEREDGDRVNGFDGAEDYDNLLDRTTYGGFVMFSPPVVPFSVIAEYYLSSGGKMSFAEGVGENPFTEDDEIDGKGYGIGITTGVFPAQGSIILRNITYDSFTLSGTETNLPNERFEKLNTWEIILQAGVAVDLL